ncbi:hypothetical protein FNF31_01327 [Cafeteria roenbergensis]|uniref:SAM domain-containing protein n=1 Tax=Cafeteria roenbergensis TaxID=33653 RepID=A0A5A8DN32_CAFRO|nr:hypothetical protein FNF31_01327 [Cafeteria roenbergensis]
MAATADDVYEDEPSVPRSRRVSVGAAADPNIELVSAAHDGDLARVKEALEVAKADINFQDAMGQTALHIAVYHNRPDVVQYLVLRGADTDLRSNDDLTAYQLAVAEGEKECASLIRTRTRDLKLIRKKHRRISQEAEVGKLISTVERRQLEASRKRAVARRAIEESKEARSARQTSRTAIARAKAEADEAAAKLRGELAEGWKVDSLGAEAASRIATVTLESDGKGQREARVGRIVRRALAVFAEGIGGFGALRANKRKAAAGDLTAGISPEVAARLVAMARSFLERKHKARLAALPGPDAGGAIVGDGQDPAASFRRSVRRVKTAARLGAAIRSLGIGRAGAAGASAAGNEGASPLLSRGQASASAAPTSSVWKAAAASEGAASPGPRQGSLALPPTPEASPARPGAIDAVGASSGAAARAAAAEELKALEKADQRRAAEAASSPRKPSVLASTSAALSPSPPTGVPAPAVSSPLLARSAATASREAASATSAGSSGSGGFAGSHAVPHRPAGLSTDSTSPRSAGAFSGRGSAGSSMSPPAGSLGKVAAAAEAAAVGTGSMGRPTALGDAIGATGPEAAAAQALALAPGDEKSLTPSEAALLGTPNSKNGGAPHDVASLAALRAEAAHRLWVAAHEVANPGVVTAMVAAARGGADEACRASGEAVRFWLRAMLLERYADSLLAAGFDTMERVALMEEEDLQAVFKMVQSEPSLAEAAAGRAPPPRKGRMRMPPGHARQLLKAVGQIRRLMDEADIEVMAEAADPLGLG